MSEPTAVAVREQAILLYQNPKEIVERATKQAEALMDIVEKKGLYKQIGPKKHLYVEAWQTIARFNECLIGTAWSRPLAEGGKMVGYEARADLIRLADGVVLVSAEAECRFDEENWDDRDSYAVRSMAQTRAQSKVGRMAYAWVAVLGGYAGTPAEEMASVEGPRVPFGRDKGKLVSELTDPKDISWLADAVAKSLTDPAKSRYKPQNERLHAALTARLAEVFAPAAPPPEGKEADERPPGDPGAAGASEEWRRKFEVELFARRDEFDKKGTVLRKLMEDAGILHLLSIQTSERALDFLKEYLKRTGKGQGELPRA